MGRELTVDFSPLARRKAKSDFYTTCSHMPDCYVWESTDGPIPVCQMGDFHLLGAYRKAEAWPILSEERAAEQEEALDSLMDEINRRGIRRML